MTPPRSLEVGSKQTEWKKCRAYEKILATNVTEGALMFGNNV